MNQPPKHLLQECMHEQVQKLINIPGWDILQENNLLALKTPMQLPLANLAWGNPTAINIKKVQKFYNLQKFSWYIESLQDTHFLLKSDFTGPDHHIEMVLDLDTYKTISDSPNINICAADTEILFQQWAQVASETYNYGLENIKEFYLPFIKKVNNIPYLAFYNNEPAATGLLFCGKNAARIFAMTTRLKFRHKGLGKAILQACIATAKQQVNFAVLYASEMGKSLYEKAGFKSTQSLYKYDH